MYCVELLPVESCLVPNVYLAPGFPGFDLQFLSFMVSWKHAIQLVYFPHVRKYTVSGTSHSILFNKSGSMVDDFAHL